MEKCYILWPDDLLLFSDGSVKRVEFVGEEDIALSNGEEARRFSREIWEELRPALRYVVRENRWMECGEQVLWE